MKARILLLLGIIGIFISFNAVGQEYPYRFRPIVFWENNVDIGVILTTYTKMVIVDFKGGKHGEVIAKDQVVNIYMAPSGKKLVYTTAKGVWLTKIDTNETQQVVNGYCDYLRWGADSLSFIFTVDANSNAGNSASFDVKVFWADGDGKNIKQVYP